MTGARILQPAGFSLSRNDSAITSDRLTSAKARAIMFYFLIYYHWKWREWVFWKMSNSRARHKAAFNRPISTSMYFNGIFTMRPKPRPLRSPLWKSVIIVVINKTISSECRNIFGYNQYVQFAVCICNIRYRATRVTEHSILQIHQVAYTRVPR